MSNSHQTYLQRLFLSLWYQKKYSAVFFLLLPLSLILRALVPIRRHFLSRRTRPFKVPIVVVGNITVGGTGKTPVVIAIAQALVEQGLQVGIISRGYGGTYQSCQMVDGNTDVKQSGDEALLIAQQTHCPVAISRKRNQAVELLLENHPHTDIIVSDDGLQHYSLKRNFEIVVIDGERKIGNGFCLPAGPMREPRSRLNSVDWVLVNKNDEIAMDFSSTPVNNIQLRPAGWHHLKTKRTVALSPLPWSAKDSPVTAIAGIGNPERFFDSLRQLKIDARTIAFDDHHRFTKKDFDTLSEPLVMTEKDAIKCIRFAKHNWWSLQVKVTLPQALIHSVIKLASQ
ncbi:MAG: tetraacyldisaccharide 4'-kinase [Pseudomonadota bacterium]